ncbi:hypothetical protein AALO_G00268910 [Alosa alosa]|uniref:Tight junction protein ZO-1 n=1 Tax=Alosa alosa TaxID=278164 RepID=A0AAV6FM55_9TELE|nr:hypothetical protein AALO_G00268910 [Alosa alosa]
MGLLSSPCVLCDSWHRLSGSNRYLGRGQPLPPRVGETAHHISDVLTGGPAEGLLQENDRVVMVNAVSMDNVEHAYAVQQLRKSGKNAKITIRRKRKVQIPWEPGRRPGDDMSEPETRRGTREGVQRPGLHWPAGKPARLGTARQGQSGENGPLPRDRSQPVASNTPPMPAKVTSSSPRTVWPALASHIQEGHLPRVWQHSRWQHPGSETRVLKVRPYPRVDLITERDLITEHRLRLESLFLAGQSPPPRAGTHHHIPDVLTEGQPRALAKNWSQRRLGDGTPRRTERTGHAKGTGAATSAGLQHRPSQSPAKVTLVKSRKNEEYGLRLASHIFVKDISPESLAARDGNIQEGDVVLKINGTVTENLSLIDAKKLIERSKGKLKMVVQRDERATLLNIPDMDDSIASANSDRDDISEIHSLASDHSHDRTRGARSRSPDKRSEPSDLSRQSPQQISNGSHRRSDEDRMSSKPGASTPIKGSEETLHSQPSEPSGSRDEKQIPPLPEPKPVYAQPGQPDVDLPVSPSDAPVPSAAHDDSILRPSMKLVKFKKGESVGLRLAGGNDVGIFVAGVLEDSPAAKEGLEEGDQILRVNNVDFANIIREEAVLFLLDLPRGEEVTILAQKKKDVYRRIVESDVGDSFYIRTHFEYEKESPYGLSFNKGEVFRVVDTLYNGKLGSWLAIRIGKNHQEVERGIIPNKNRAEQLSSVHSKRNLRKSREDLSAQPVQTKFPAYERVVLREAGFLRPVVIFGPIADTAREKLSREVPDLFELAKTQNQDDTEKSEPRDAGTDQRSSGIIRLHTIKQIIDRDKHAVLDITPNAVDRLNYAQWYPIVVFLNPDSKQGVKNMRSRLCPESRKSARKLYERALKLRKNNHHLFTATINMNNMNDGWYGSLKDTIQQQQNQLVWVSEGKLDRLSYLSRAGARVQHVQPRTTPPPRSTGRTRCRRRPTPTRSWARAAEQQADRHAARATADRILEPVQQDMAVLQQPPPGYAAVAAAAAALAAYPPPVGNR